MRRRNIKYGSTCETCETWRYGFKVGRTVGEVRILFTFEWLREREGGREGGERLPCWNDFSVIATISNLFATFHYFASQSPACHSTVPGPRPSLFLCHVSSSIQFFKWILTKVYLYIYILEVDRDTMKVNFSFLPFPYPMASCRLIYVPFFLYLERTFLSRSKKLLLYELSLSKKKKKKKKEK